jgi:hypothetical protein
MDASFVGSYQLVSISACQLFCRRNRSARTTTVYSDAIGDRFSIEKADWLTSRRRRRADWL